MGLAILLPLAGIAVLLATGLQGRSGLIGRWHRVADSAGRQSNVQTRRVPRRCRHLLLLVGDFSTSGARSALVASLVAFGYMLLIVWFAWTAWFLMSRTSAGAVLESGLQPARVGRGRLLT